MPPTLFQLPTDREAEVGDHRAGEVRRQAQDDLATLRACGVALVELVTTEDLAVCPACGDVARRTYAIDIAPLFLE